MVYRLALVWLAVLGAAARKILYRVHDHRFYRAHHSHRFCRVHQHPQFHRAFFYRVLWCQVLALRGLRFPLPQLRFHRHQVQMQ